MNKMEMTEREAQFWDACHEDEKEAQRELFRNGDELGWEDAKITTDILDNIDAQLYNVGLNIDDFRIRFGIIDTEDGNDTEVDARQTKDEPYRQFVLEEVQADLDDKVIFFWVYEV